jgi:uridine kinase
MSSDELIQSLIRDGDFILSASGLDDEAAVMRIVSLLREINKKDTKVISLIGGAASGKSTLANRVAVALEDAAVISTDDFLLGTREYRKRFLDFEGADPLKKYNFDLLRDKVEKIRNLREGEFECLPLYDEKSGAGIDIVVDQENGEITHIQEERFPRKVGRVEFLIIEGDFQVDMQADFRIFFHVPDEVRLKNRIDRDLKERGATNTEEVTANFESRQKLQHRPYTVSQARCADLLITVRAIVLKPSCKYEHSFWTAHL